MSDQPYVYVEADSSLYWPDGSYLKKIYCPKAVTWNQLIADDPEDRSRGCTHCYERVMNLDTVSVGEVVQALEANPDTCLFGSEKVVRFLSDPNKLKPPEIVTVSEPVEIQTARNELNINRGAAIGFRPKVELVKFDPEKPVAVGEQVVQNLKTGRVIYWRVWRESVFNTYELSDSQDDWVLVINWTTYPKYQSKPFAAYMIPKGLSAGTRVVVRDPIEAIEGYGPWDKEVYGIWDGKDIILETDGFAGRGIVG